MLPYLKSKLLSRESQLWQVLRRIIDDTRNSDYNDCRPGVRQPYMWRTMFKLLVRETMQTHCGYWCNAHALHRVLHRMLPVRIHGEF